ncbi:MAG: beta-N-acetylhexosaminidase [Verrucomicrobia bacterium]|nr:beta-N-acetylhexosaminidase [Verrucomicrobiota bacterium]
MNPNPRVCRLLAALAWLLMAGPTLPAAPGPSPALIPLPARLTPTEGSFLLGPKTTIQIAKSEAAIGEILAGAIERSAGFKVPVLTVSKPAPSKRAISLWLDATRAGLGDEGYALEITPKGISVTAAKRAGLLYGVQTLRQLLPLQPIPGQTAYPLAGIQIEDAPRFGWRGYLLDCSRHFIAKQTIMDLLPALALIKINVFHWHLVDDQAWRLAIPNYPQLVAPVVGSWNAPSQASGYYTASDVRDIVNLARQLHITIVPELEMPSHATQAAAALTAASCLGADGKPLPSGTTREICLGSDQAIAALQDILVATMALFPDSPYIHLGGDEAEDVHWKACARCQARMAQLGITDARLLQKWFMDKMNRFVRAQGRTSVAWADRLALGIPEGQIVHGWHAGELEAAVAKGFRAIQSQHDYTYFDYGQGLGDTFAGGGALDLARVYALDPVRGLTPEQARLVLGVQAQLWTEEVPDERVFVKTFPRILALAEVGWTPPGQREGAEFNRRLAAFLPRLDALGIPYYKPRVLLGKWSPELVAPSWKDLDWNITAEVKRSGAFEVELLFQRGKSAINIQSAMLLEDGREISRDDHIGVAGAIHQENTYRLRVAALKAGATYVLRARIRCLEGNDSHGVVLLR